MKLVPPDPTIRKLEIQSAQLLEQAVNHPDPAIAALLNRKGKEKFKALQLAKR